jgi:flagellin-specific chaperone FliS
MIVKLGRLKKHLGTIYDWKQDKLVNANLEASMPKMIYDISEKFE